MKEREIFSLLVCPECRNKLNFEIDHFYCETCKRKYPLKDEIPVFGFKDEEIFWKDFFNSLTEKMGGSEKANAYFNRKSFLFTKNILLEAIGEPKGKRIVDIGCGTGHATSSLAKNNLLLGIDLSLKILYHARMNGLFPIQCSATRIPLPSSLFDIVICNNLLQTVREGEEVLDEIERITAEKGRVFIATSNKEGILNNIFLLLEMRKYKKMRLYSLEEISSYLIRKNFKISNFFYLYFPIMKVWKNRKSPFIKLISTSFLIEAEKNEG
ncbi:MAG: methyltransferase domain-containing protein [Candidatus Aminicenantia bacterium]